MKKYILTLFCAMTLVGVTKVFAQPTVSINPDFDLILAGQKAQLDFRVNDFTDIQAMRFSVRWDPDVVTIASPADIFNANPLMTNLVLATDVTYDNVEGWLVFDWQVMDPLDCSSTLDVTLADNAVLFSVNFTGITSYTHVTIGDDPVEQYVTRTSSCPIDIMMFSDDGFIAVNNLPITLDIPYVNANEGETVCLDFTVDDFFDIISFQFTVGWDPTVLEFVSATGLNLPNFSGSNTNPFPNDGYMTVSWFNTPDGVTLPDGTAILQICFNVIGGCAETSIVSILDDPTPIEITNASDPGTDIGFLAGEGQLAVNCFNPDGLTVMVESAQVSPGENFCLDLTVENFVDLVGFEFSINWNPNLLDFTGFQNVNNNLFFFNSGNWDQSQANNGVLTVSWNDPSCFGDDLANGEILSSLCFKAIGGCVNSPVSITNNPLDINVIDQCFGNDIGINTFNGLVEIVCPDGIILSTANYNLDPGDFICIPVEVQNFTKIEDLTFTIEWETSVLQFVSVGNFGLPNLTNGNFDASFAAFGAMCLDWTDLSGAGITLVDGTAIFDLCFNVVGDPYECSPINFTDFPCGINVVTTESSGVNVGLTSQPGEVCVNNPFNFIVDISQNNGVLGEEVCVDVTVENFVSLEQLAFSINWNPSQLQYSQLINPLNLANFSTASYDDSNGGVGSISIDWNSQTLNGNSLPNGSVIFTLCFDLIGDEGNCEDITITSSPQAIQVIPANSGGINIGLNADNGGICILESLQVAASITGVDCPGDNTGNIDITVSGGSGNYSYEWSGPGITVPNMDQEDQGGLTNQTYTVIVTDVDNPVIFIEQQFDVPLSGFSPVADAGDDVSLPCGSSLFTLDGTGSSQGVGQYSYLWTGLGGGSVQPGTETTLMPTIFGPGNYQLMVTDETTNCVVFDTIFVEAAVIPGVQIQALDSIDCTVDTVAITSVGSSGGPNFTYLWTTDTGFIVPGTETTQTAMVTGEGWYFLNVTNILSDCSSADSAFITVDTIAPVADAGMDQVIDCNNNTATLDGSLSSSGPDISYGWMDPMGGMAGTTASITASDIGIYTLTVTNTANSCTDFDQVEIVGDLQLPIANAGADQFITCLVSVVTLNGAGSSTGPDFSYQWVAISGNLVPGTETMMSAQADQAGEYQLTVTDIVNGCDAVSTVFVIEDLQAPVAQAGLPDTITCDVPSLFLSGAGSSVGTLGEFQYLWTGPGVVTGSTGLAPEVDAGGTYYLEVTDTFNGCTALDSVTIVDEQDNVVAFLAMPDTINCTVACINLDGTGTSVGPNIVYSWSGNPCINTSNPLNPQVCCAGTFTLEVTDTSTGCTATASVTVIEDVDVPIAVTNDATYTCNDDCFNLDATGSSTGPDYVYAWTPIPAGNGSIDSGEDTLEPLICAPGIYGLVITDTTNGCFVTATVNVAADTIPPTAIISGDVQITCNTPVVTLDGSLSGPGVSEFQWYQDGASLPGATMDMLDASSAGEYVLEVTGTNGCSATDTTQLFEALPPVADADEETELGCGEDLVTIQNTGSSSGVGIEYSWTALSGTLDPASTTLQNAVATSEGTFVLTVTDMITGCSAMDTVEVISGLGSLTQASFSYDQEACTDEAMLFGTTGEGTTGVWSVLTNADIEFPTIETSPITNLEPGINIVTWTLSAPGCPDYSSFSDTIFVESFPIANNDTAEMGENDSSVMIPVLDNDFLNGNSGMAIAITTPPVIGTVTGLVDGFYTYTPPVTFGGEVEFNYAICSDVCPNLCDTALVLINVDKELVMVVPNGITPNGDGKNDALVFDILLLNPDKFPQNKITIFNRWGDIVYEAAPYLNDWTGTNQSGQDLPQATYYFVFRLDVGESEIIRGDITIVR
ncbi:MAG: gliding motility-associated C-terminal domain-containing protein [Saprospiraceae bacterium]|nr:gliding motility-associated C-terminal domain-containing protein [Saprospiraceae bacterium]